jgi:hypothetical protein
MRVDAKNEDFQTIYAHSAQRSEQNIRILRRAGEAKACAREADPI